MRHAWLLAAVTLALNTGPALAQAPTPSSVASDVGAHLAELTRPATLAGTFLADATPPQPSPSVAQTASAADSPEEEAPATATIGHVVQLGTLPPGAVAAVDAQVHQLEQDAVETFRKTQAENPKSIGAWVRGLLGNVPAEAWFTLVGLLLSGLLSLLAHKLPAYNFALKALHFVIGNWPALTSELQKWLASRKAGAAVFFLIGASLLAAPARADAPQGPTGATGTPSTSVSGGGLDIGTPQHGTVTTMAAPPTPVPTKPSLETIVQDGLLLAANPSDPTVYAKIVQDLGSGKLGDYDKGHIELRWGPIGGIALLQPQRLLESGFQTTGLKSGFVGIGFTLAVWPHSGSFLLDISLFLAAEIGASDQFTHAPVALLLGLVVATPIKGVPIGFGVGQPVYEGSGAGIPRLPQLLATVHLPDKIF